MIPKQHSFGGSALDRLIFDYEAVSDAPAGEVAPAPDVSGAAEPAAPDAAAAPAEPAAPEPAGGWAPDDPAFLEAVDLRAAELIEARLQQYQPDAAQPQGDQVDWREVMNPLSDEYDPERFYQSRDQFLLNQVKELINPLLQQTQQSAASEGQKLVESFIETRWQPASDGDLTAEHKTAIQAMAPSFLGEMNQRFGEGRTAAEQALAKATETIRAINRAARGSGEARNAAELAAVANAAATPAGGTAALQGAGTAETVDEALARFLARSNTQAA